MGDFTTEPARQGVLSPAAARVVVLCLAWYAVSATTSQLSKAVLSQLPFPLLLGQTQFCCAALLCGLTTCLLYSSTALRHAFPPGSVPSRRALSESNSRFFILPTRQILLSILPMGVFQFSGKFFSHAATSLVPVATASSIKTLSPLLVVLTYRLYYRVSFPLSTYLTLLPIAAGVWVIISADPRSSKSSSSPSSEPADSLRGCLFALASCFIFVVQNIYGKKVVTYNSSKMKENPALLALASAEKHQQLLPLSNNNSSVSIDRIVEKKSLESEKMENYLNLADKSPTYSQCTYHHDNYGPPSAVPPQLSQEKKPVKLDKLTILFYCSVFGSLFNLPALLLSELPKLFTSRSTSSDPQSTIQPGMQSAIQVASFQVPWLLLLLNGVSHFAQALISFHVLGQIPTVTYSIASLLKRIVIITVSMLWANQAISQSQFLGLVLVGAGLYSYDKYGGGSFLKEKKKKNESLGSGTKLHADQVMYNHYNDQQNQGFGFPPGPYSATTSTNSASYNVHASRSPSPKIEIMINDKKLEC